MQHTNILQQSLTLMQENIIQDLQQFVSKATTKFMTKLDDTLSNVYNNVKHMVYQTLTTANKNLRSASQVILNHSSKNLQPLRRPGHSYLKNQHYSQRQI